ncbi:TadE family protein [Paenibacillus sp. M1]|uniref:TadE family protein n=1 Tax=Paenibacillus haidiansis TaxID=1574488 RepID=A0ABU7VW06_9BACL
MKRLLRNREGSFTLEASLVLPVILTSILILLFFCMFLYQRSLLGQVAIVAAERSAYAWDNSSRDPVSGAYPQDEYDSLYWRLTDDGMLNTIFGLGQQTSSARLSLPAEEGQEGTLAFRKLYRTGTSIPEGMNGTMEYDNKVLLRKVTVSLNRLVPLIPLERAIGDLTQEAQASAYIVDPVEWVRTVELARYYGAKFQGAGGDRVDRLEAGNALRMFGK